MFGPAPLASVCLALVLGCNAVAAADQPNLVLIFVDDMGYGDIGPFGSKVNRTPHLDRMATEGMKLTSFYAAPVCSASRAQLMTGCYAPRVSVPGVFFPAGPRGLNPAEHTIAEYLHDAGYATMCVGKWHLGDQQEFLPTKQGFDGYFGIPYSNDMGRKSLKDGRNVHPLMRDDKVAVLLEDEGQRRITREYTEEAVRFIQKNKQQPFFLYLAHTAMHVPLFPHPDFVGKSENGTYGDWVAEVDWSVGKILHTLRQNDLAENTLVLFTSDNGPWASTGNAGGVSGPLRGSKGCTLEGGVREPTIAWWPGKVPANSTSAAISGTTDVLPTFVSLAGGKTREDIRIDGKDLSSLLLGKTEESPHKAWFYYQGTNLQAVRSGPWKLALTSQSIGMGFRERPEDLSRGGRLYNLETEINETTNLAAEHPEIVAELTKLAETMMADIGSGKPGPGVRPPGVVEKPVTLFPTQSRNRPRTPVKTKPIDWQKIKTGDTYPSASAPDVSGKPFLITLKIESTQPDGLLLAHGGSAVGYALYVQNEKVVFAVRQSSTKINRVSLPISAGNIELHASLLIDKSMKLTNADGAAKSLAAVGYLPKHPQEDFCIGHDNKNPLDPQAPTTRFKGKVSQLRIEAISPDANTQIKPPSVTQIAEYNLDAAFFKKCLMAEDVLIATSARVSDVAIYEAAYQFRQIMQCVKPEIAQRIRQQKVLCILLGHTELTSEVPQFKTNKTGKELDFYNWRQRGFLTRKDGRPTVVFAEEDVLEYPGGMQDESILIHEFGHVIHGAGFDGVLQQRLTDTFNAARDSELWVDGRAAQRFRRVTSTEPVSLRDALVKAFPDQSAQLIEQCLDGGDILVNGKPTTSTVQVTKEDKVLIVFGGPKECYAHKNRAEYWAEGVQCWFNTNRTMDHDHNHIHTREQLKNYDRRLAKLCEDVLGDTPWRFVSPRDRAGNAHLKRFDPADSPKVVDPEHIQTAAYDYYDTYWKDYWQRLKDKHTTADTQ